MWDQNDISLYFLVQKDRWKDPVVMWQYLEKNIPDFNPVSGLCKLCTRKKFQIGLNPHEPSMSDCCYHFKEEYIS